MFSAIFGSRQDRALRPLRPLVAAVRERAAHLRDRQDLSLPAETDRLRAHIAVALAPCQATVDRLLVARRNAVGEALAQLDAELAEAEAALRASRRAALDAVLCDAAAAVVEACRRLVGVDIEVLGHRIRWDMEPYDVQILGGLAMHRGAVVEMATGEGKTLAAAFPIYLAALAGQGVHVVTANAYLAARDAQWMGALFRTLGMTVGCIDQTPPASADRRAAYACDITYGTPSEFGFDYLRDHMAMDPAACVQRGQVVAIIDEVDSILIDEARTPLIISGPATSRSFRDGDPLVLHRDRVATLAARQAEFVDAIAAKGEVRLAAGDSAAAAECFLVVRRGAPTHPRLRARIADTPWLAGALDALEARATATRQLGALDDQLFYTITEDDLAVTLSEQGLAALSPDDPNAFVLPDLAEIVGAIEADMMMSSEEKHERVRHAEAHYAERAAHLHAVHQLLRAYTLFRRDEHYIVQDGEVLIVDEFTGRAKAGRRWSNGLHQAIEVKEGLRHRGETRTLATITLQNYFRRYERLAGMTGTAVSEEAEFQRTYGLPVVVIPTHRPVRRQDRDDLVFRTAAERDAAVLAEIERLHRLALPVLVGTTSVEASEALATQLTARGIPHTVLNAKHHAREAEIIARAGQPGAVTIATNMAGRGTDIKLHPDTLVPRTVAWLAARGIDPATVVSPYDPPAADGGPGEAGLQVIGTARHTARRIDRQLRGRAGRQGDPGTSRFFLSLEDPLLRQFGGEDVARVLRLLGTRPGVPMRHRPVTRLVERAQARIEQEHFADRKRLFDFDTVVARQRDVVYAIRDETLHAGEGLVDDLRTTVDTVVGEIVRQHFALPRDAGPETWDLPGLQARLARECHLDLPTLATDAAACETAEAVQTVVINLAHRMTDRQLACFGPRAPWVTGVIVRQALDEAWRDHLEALTRLRETIQYRAVGEYDPLRAYTEEALTLFETCMQEFSRRTAELLFTARMTVDAPDDPTVEAPPAVAR